MAVRTTYGVVAGAATGAAPFLLIGVHTTSWAPAAAAMLLAATLCATAWRTPLALVLGVLLGTLAAAGALMLYVGSDWRLLPYVALSFPLYYAAAAVGFFARAWYAARRFRAATG